MLKNYNWSLANTITSTVDFRRKYVYDATKTLLLNSPFINTSELT